MHRLKSMFKSTREIFILGILLGALIILAIRFVTYRPEQSVHHHANFAVYVNGAREAFTNPLYYEEAGAACEEHAEQTPGERVHMHGRVSDVVHVHDNAVTWGNFFENMGWSIGGDFLKTETGLFVANGENKLVFMLNGEVVSSVANREIKSLDKLLISYGTGQDTAAEFATVADTAQKYNVESDPAGCKGSAPTTFKDRLKHLF
jgi:hypothetical protein